MALRCWGFAGFCMLLVGAQNLKEAALTTPEGACLKGSKCLQKETSPLGLVQMGTKGGKSDMMEKPEDEVEEAALEPEASAEKKEKPKLLAMLEAELLQHMHLEHLPRERQKRLRLVEARLTPADENLKHLKAAEHIASIFAENLRKNAKGGAGDKRDDFSMTLEAILGLLQGIMNEQRTEHGQDVKSLHDLELSFESCKKTALDAFAAGGKVNVTDNLMKIAESTHQKCRVTQSIEKQKTTNNCMTASDMWTPPPECTLKQPTTSPSQTEQTALVDCMDRWQAWLSEQYQRQDICKSNLEALAVVSETCRSNQGDFEKTFCTYADVKQSTCSAQDQCFNYLAELRTERVAEVEINKNVRKDAFTKTNRIKCLIEALASFADSTDVHEVDVEKCQEKFVDTMEFNVTYFPVPSKGDCMREPFKPCDQGWKNVYYSPTKIPTLDETPVDVCTACVTSELMNGTTTGDIPEEEEEEVAPAEEDKEAGAAEVDLPEGIGT